jgi:hypothetical protein
MNPKNPEEIFDPQGTATSANTDQGVRRPPEEKPEEPVVPFPGDDPTHVQQR